MDGCDLGWNWGTVETHLADIAEHSEFVGFNIPDNGFGITNWCAGTAVSELRSKLYSSFQATVFSKYEATSEPFCSPYHNFS